MLGRVQAVMSVEKGDISKIEVEKLTYDRRLWGHKRLSPIFILKAKKHRPTADIPINTTGWNAQSK